MTRIACAVAAAAALSACHRGTAPHALGTAGEAGSGNETTSPLGNGLTPRCRPSTGGLVLEKEPALAELAVGDAVTVSGGLAVGIVDRKGSTTTASVVLLPPDAASFRRIDLGPAIGDAPPPRVVPDGAGWLAVSYLSSKGDEVRKLGVYAATAGGEVKLAGSLSESRDESLAFDASSSLVVWDEMPAGSSRGVIRIAARSADALGPPHDLSTPDVDAEMPRIGSHSSSMVFWIARKPGSPEIDATPSASEVTGEVGSNAWLEAVTVDAHGSPLGAPRRLTPESGHISSYDVATRPAGAASEWVVVARDEGEVVDGSGGTLLVVRVRADGQDPPAILTKDGLGRGVPNLIPGWREQGPGTWLTWTGPREQGRLSPLQLEDGAVSLRSITPEPALDDALPLAWVDGARLLVASPADTVAQLRLLDCRP